MQGGSVSSKLVPMDEATEMKSPAIDPYKTEWHWTQIAPYQAEP